MFVEEVVISLQENPCRSVGRLKKIGKIGDDILQGSGRRYVVVMNIKRDFLIHGCQLKKNV